MHRDAHQYEDPSEARMTTIADAGLQALTHKATELGFNLDKLGVLVICVEDENAEETLAGIAAHIDNPVNGLQIALSAATSLAETAGIQISLMRLPKDAQMEGSADAN